MSYHHELKIAELAVQKAVVVTRRVLALRDRGTLVKPNDSPISLGDLAAQALLVAAIRNNFPNDHIIGEEDAGELRRDPALADRLWDLVFTTRLDDDESERLLKSPASIDEMLRMIDEGITGDNDVTSTLPATAAATINSSTPIPRRAWTIDPIDGTKGYLTDGQYVVCAALLVDGVDQVAALGCPHVNLAQGRISEEDADLAGPGILVSAVRGQGVQTRPLSIGARLPATPLARRDPVSDLATLRYADNLKPTSPQVPDPTQFATRLGVSYHPARIHSTQLRYVGLALGLFDVVARVPKLGYGPECVWDHAGGRMICEEVGVFVRDARGRKLDLSLGRTLDRNWGIVATVDGAREDVQRVVAEVLSEHPRYKKILEADATEKWY